MYNFNATFSFNYTIDWDLAFILGTSLTVDGLINGDIESTKGIELPSLFTTKVNLDVETHCFGIYSTSDQ